MFLTGEIHPLIAGLCMVFTNIGMRFMHIDFGKRREALLNRPIVKYILIFCVGLVATRKILYAICILCVFTVFMYITEDIKDNGEIDGSVTAASLFTPAESKEKDIINRVEPVPYMI